MLLRKDFHMHPTIVASPERMESFIESALSKNIYEICVTDHMPLSISNASDRIPCGMVREYCRSVREMKKKYEGKIDINCGIEIDFHPSVMSEIEQVLEEGEFDFILASSHMHIFIKEYPQYTFNDFAAAALENSIRAVEMGRFHALAHLDMYRFAFENPYRFPLVNDVYDVDIHKTLINELLDKMAENGMRLEINPHLADNKRDVSFFYPEEAIVKWALEKDVSFSYGSDAHKPNSVGAYICELEKHPVYGQAIQVWENDIGK